MMRLTAVVDGIPATYSVNDTDKSIIEIVQAHPQLPLPERLVADIYKSTCQHDCDPFPDHFPDADECEEWVKKLILATPLEDIFNPQVEDNEDKEVREDCGAETTEEVHGGDEATNTIEDSPSKSLDSQDEKTPGQKGENGEDSTTEGFSGKPSGNKPKDGGSNGEGKGEKGSKSTDESSKHEDHAEIDGRKRSDTHSQSDVRTHHIVDLEKLTEVHLSTEEYILKVVMPKIMNSIKGSGHSNRRQGWDGSKICKHFLAGQLQKIPNDRKRRKQPGKAAIFVDLSGSIWYYISTFVEVISKLAKQGLDITLYDASNGFNYKESTGPGCKNTEDPYENRARLAAKFVDRHCKLHPDITTPSCEEAARIMDESEVSIIFADYDGFASFSEASFLVRKINHVAWFIDMDCRYEDPADHDWNNGVNTYANCHHWFKVVDQVTEDDYDDSDDEF